MTDHSYSSPYRLGSDTDNATCIPAEQAPPHKRRKFRRLRAYNTGLWNGPKRENKEARRRQNDLHRYDAISSTLELTDHQHRRGRRILDALDLSKNLTSREYETTDAVSWAVCVLVVNNDTRDTRYWPHSDAEDNDQMFRDLAEELNLTKSHQMSLLNRIRSKTTL